MKKTLVLFSLLFFTASSGFCATTFFAPLAPKGTNINTYSENFQPPSELTKKVENNLNQVNYLRLNQIEKTLYGKVYSNQNINSRLSRIEKSIFSRTYPSATLVQRMDNIVANFTQITQNTQYKSISQNILSQMENKVFNETYSEYDTQSRIEQMEQKVFGAVQSGDLDTRYKSLRSALRTYNNPTTITQTQTGGWKGLAKTLGSSMLGGTMTGFTPPITPYYNSNSYDPYYNNYNNYNPSSGMYRGFRSNRGYYDEFTNYGTGSKVTILD